MIILNENINTTYMLTNQLLLYAVQLDGNVFFIKSNADNFATTLHDIMMTRYCNSPGC